MIVNVDGEPRSVVVKINSVATKPGAVFLSLYVRCQVIDDVTGQDVVQCLALTDLRRIEKFAAETLNASLQAKPTLWQRVRRRFSKGAA